MAIFKQKIAAGGVSEINKNGRYIKVINCQSEVNMRVFNADGSLMVDTSIRAGFEVSLSPFSLVVISSDYDQEYEMWVDLFKLGYDAPTAGSNFNQSLIVNHYGDSQKVLGFEPSRVAVTLFSDELFWYGGEGVNKSNGIPVAAGVEKRILGAGELHIAIDKYASYTPTGESDYIKMIGNHWQYGFMPNTPCWAGEYCYFVTSQHKSAYCLRDGVIDYVRRSNGEIAATGCTLSAVRDDKVYLSNDAGRVYVVEDGIVVADIFSNSSKRVDSFAVRSDGALVAGLGSGGSVSVIGSDGVYDERFKGASIQSAPYVAADSTGAVYVCHGQLTYFFENGVIPENAADAVHDDRFSPFKYSQENNKFICLIGLAPLAECTVVNKITKDVIKLGFSTSQITAARDGYLYALVGGTLKKSGDGVKWVDVATGLGTNDAKSKLLFTGKDLLVVPEGRVNVDGWEQLLVRKYKAKKDETKPLAGIRMLKESV